MSAVALLHHYLEYVLSPPTLLSLLVVVAPLLLSASLEKAAKGTSETTQIPGLRRFGLRRHSNLLELDHNKTTNPQVKALITYPILSSLGVELTVSEVAPSGLKYNGTFALAQLTSTPVLKPEDEEPSTEWKHEWRAISSTDFPNLTQLKLELWLPDPKAKLKPNEWVTNGGCLVLRFPFEPDYNFLGLRTEILTMRLPLFPTPERAKSREYLTEPLFIKTTLVDAVNMTKELDPRSLEKLAYFLGVRNPLGVFRLDYSKSHRMPIKLGCGATDKAHIFVNGLEKSKWKQIAMGRRIGRDEQGLFETDAEYRVTEEGTVTPIFEYGIVKVGDGVDVLAEFE